MVWRRALEKDGRRLVAKSMREDTIRDGKAGVRNGI